MTATELQDKAEKSGNPQDWINAAFAWQEEGNKENMIYCMKMAQLLEL